MKGKTKEMKGGLVWRRGLVLQTTRGVRVHVGECEAGEQSVCVRAFRASAGRGGWGGGSFVHRDQREEGEVRVGE